MVTMPQPHVSTKIITTYEVVNEIGDVFAEFENQEEANAYLNDWLLQISQIEEEQDENYEHIN